MIYLDTSALIKRYLEEPGSSLVRSFIADDSALASATLAYVETHATFARRRREGHLPQKEYAALSEHFENDWATWVRIPLQDDILTLARDLIRRHPLRGSDAVHLASALTLARDLTAHGEMVTVVAADHRLLQAAAAEHLDTRDVSPV